MSSDEDSRVRLIAGSDSAIIDQLLKEKGITREQVAEAILKTRAEEEEAKRKALEEEARIDRELVERARRERLSDALKTKMVMTIDRRKVMPAEAIQGIKCPSCDKENETLRYCAQVFVDRFARVKAQTIAFDGENLMLEDGPFRMSGSLTCKNCGEQLQVLLTATSPG